jgi:hypothetical protein
LLFTQKKYPQSCRPGLGHKLVAANPRGRERESPKSEWLFSVVDRELFLESPDRISRAACGPEDRFWLLFWRKKISCRFFMLWHFSSPPPLDGVFRGLIKLAPRVLSQHSDGHKSPKLEKILVWPGTTLVAHSILLIRARASGLSYAIHNNQATKSRPRIYRTRR